jgi:WD40 repeat protein
VKLIPNHFADPITALCLSNDYIMIGTMMGSIMLYDIENNLSILLNELNTENISDISYNEEESAFIVSIGDKEIKVYKTINITTEQPLSINIYDSEMKHNQNCQNSYVLLSPYYLFRIQLEQIEDNSFFVSTANQEYELKEINMIEDNNKNYIGKLQMTNYSVPFDFDGNNFLWVEFLSSENRNICIADVMTMLDSAEEKPKKYNLDKDIIKHISFAKIINDKKIFIIHSKNICEIRLLDDKFTIEEKFIHIGEEVYAIDLFFENENNYLSIITLDIKGNVNLYQNKNEITLFNMYNLNTIPKDYKEKQFFSMEYQYFIKSDLNYFCISSDHGCFIIKKNQ